MSEQRPIDLDAIRERAAAATPAPWHWRGNYDTQRIRLITWSPRKMERTVMDFVRWGFKGAQPRFQHPMQAMDKASDMVRFEVAPDATSRADPRVYRGDIIAIAHPDADFIAHARQDVEDLLAYIAVLETRREATETAALAAD